MLNHKMLIKISFFLYYHIRTVHPDILYFMQPEKKNIKMNFNSEIYNMLIIEEFLYVWTAFLMFFFNKLIKPEKICPCAWSPWCLWLFILNFFDIQSIQELLGLTELIIPYFLYSFPILTDLNGNRTLVLVAFLSDSKDTTEAECCPKRAILSWLWYSC